MIFYFCFINIVIEFIIKNNLKLLLKCSKDSYVICMIVGFWVFVNNVGIDCFGDIEFCFMEFYRCVVDVNFFGMVYVMKIFFLMI